MIFSRVALLAYFPVVLLLAQGVVWPNFGVAAPPLGKTAKTFAISSIKQNQEVIDVAITQKGDNISLVLVVSSATSIARAKALGDNFVRLVKTFSKDEPNPTKKIGRGVYSYLIGVYTPSEKRIVLGAKASISPHITW